MAFKLGDVIIDRLQFGYGALADKALYTLTQLSEATIDITADSTDITDKDGNLVYRKYHGKKGEVTATNAFLNLSIVESISANEAEMADAGKAIPMPVFKIVKSGETLDITDAIADTFVVNALSANGSLGKAYSKGSDATNTEYKVDLEGTHTLTPPADAEEVQYLVKYKKNVKSGARLAITGDKYPKAHELYFKALAVDKCNVNGGYRAVVIHIPSFIPSPEVSLALQGGDSQTMEYKGAILTDTCSVNQEMVEIFFIDEEEEA